MKTHDDIDTRNLLLAQIIVDRIDNDPQHKGLEKARSVCKHWVDIGGGPVVHEWLHILENPWGKIKEVLLDSGEEGKRLRQSSPFCGIITPRERWEFLKRFENEAA